MKKQNKQHKTQKSIIFCDSVLDLISALGENDNNTYLFYDGDILLSFDNEKGIVKEVDSYEEAQSF